MAVAAVVGDGVVGSSGDGTTDGGSGSSSVSSGNSINAVAVTVPPPPEAVLCKAQAMYAPEDPEPFQPTSIPSKHRCWAFHGARSEAIEFESQSTHLACVSQNPLWGLMFSEISSPTELVGLKPKLRAASHSIFQIHCFHDGLQVFALHHAAPPVFGCPGGTHSGHT